jgi:hypothetical protein
VEAGPVLGGPGLVESGRRGDHRQRRPDRLRPPAPNLKALAEKHGVIGEVRGHGVFWALELVQALAIYGQALAATEILAALVTLHYIPGVSHRSHAVASGRRTRPTLHHIFFQRLSERAQRRSTTYD